jgi:hypothetical protein
MIYLQVLLFLRKSYNTENTGRKFPPSAVATWSKLTTTSSSLSKASISQNRFGRITSIKTLKQEKNASRID